MGEDCYRAHAVEARVLATSDDGGNTCEPVDHWPLKGAAFGALDVAGSKEERHEGKDEEKGEKEVMTVVEEAGEEETKEIMQPLDQWPQEEREDEDFMQPLDQWPQEEREGEDFMQPLDQWPQESKDLSVFDPAKEEEAKLRKLCDGLRMSCYERAPHIFDDWASFRLAALADDPLPQHLTHVQADAAVDVQRLVALEERLDELISKGGAAGSKDADGDDEYGSDNFEDFDEFEDGFHEPE